MMINCATLSRRLIDRVNCRTDAGTVLSVVRLASFECEAGRVAAAIGMHRPKAIHKRSITFTLARLALSAPSCLGASHHLGLATMEVSWPAVAACGAAGSPNAADATPRYCSFG